MHGPSSKCSVIVCALHCPFRPKACHRVATVGCAETQSASFLSHVSFFVEPRGGLVIERRVEDRQLVSPAVQVESREGLVLTEQLAPVATFAAAD
jgi:hypothetical protein